MKKQTYNLGIDCRFWGISHAGLGRYTRELVLSIIKQSPKDIKYTLFFQKDTNKDDKQLLKNRGCTIIEVDVPHYSLKEHFIFSRIVDKHHLDLIHYPHFNVPITSKAPFVVTIHDLIKHFFKGKPVTTRNQLVYWAKYGAYRLAVKNAVTKSQAILTPSLFVKDQIVCNYDHVPDNKVHVVYEGVSQPYNKPTRVSQTTAKAILKKYNVKDQWYFVYTGSAYYHKDLPTLLKAIKILKNKDYNVKLVIACGRNHFWQTLKQQVKDFGLTKSVVLPGRVSDEDLKVLYQHALAYIFPSLMEGFGLPGLEAMGSECPVIASNTGSLPEVYAKAATYFDAGSSFDLSEKMIQSANLEADQRQKIIDHGLNHSSEFTWEKAGSQTLKLYRNTLNSLDHE